MGEMDAGGGRNAKWIKLALCAGDTYRLHRSVRPIGRSGADAFAAVTKLKAKGRDADLGFASARTTLVESTVLSSGESSFAVGTFGWLWLGSK